MKTNLDFKPLSKCLNYQFCCYLNKKLDKIKKNISSEDEISNNMSNGLHWK